MVIFLVSFVSGLLVGGGLAGYAVFERAYHQHRHTMAKAEQVRRSLVARIAADGQRHAEERDELLRRVHMLGKLRRGETLLFTPSRVREGQA